MKLNELLNRCNSSESFNTNNAWGFGGGIGTSYKFNNDIEIRVGKAYFRHMPPHRFVRVRVDGTTIFDGHTLSDETVDEVYAMITKK